MMSYNGQWLPSSTTAFLAADEVHVWRAELNQPQSIIQYCLDQLSPDERERAERFHFDRDRHHFIVARGLLRILTGNYLNHAPSLVSFNYNDYGKPELAQPLSASGLRFNLSHSHGVALFAFNYGRELGLDIEYMRVDFATAHIAERFFAQAEVDAFTRLPIEEQPQGFFNCWTRKEAYIKAEGRGLSIPLDSFEVSLKPGEQAMLLKAAEGVKDDSGWRLADLNVGPGYAAALMVEGRDWRPKFWQWEPLASTASSESGLTQRSGKDNSEEVQDDER